MNKPTISPANEIWSILKEVAASHKEANREMEEIRASHKEANREMEEIRASHKEANREMEEIRKELRASQKETDRQMKETDRQMKETDRQIQKIGGRFNQRWGALVESLVEGKLVKIFQDQGIDITQTHTRSQSEWRKPDGRIERREFDIIVANGIEVVVVEVKTTLVPKDVSVFLKTLRDFRSYFPRYRSETIYGAMAYLASENKAHLLAEEEGLFLIRATGDSASLVNRRDFKPKSFS